MSSSPPNRHRGEGPPDAVSDGQLVTLMIEGDSAALRALMRRYDRLVRYTIFRASRDRCRRDPQWLDSVASATWAGFVQSARRLADRPPTALAAYLTNIARNHTVSALRRGQAGPTFVEAEDGVAGGTLADPDEEPTALLSRLEELESLRACVEALEPADRELMTQLPAIMDRRWRDAAGALDLAESTLRSRWARVLQRLDACLRQREGKSVAPQAVGRDS